MYPEKKKTDKNKEGGHADIQYQTDYKLPIY